MNRLEALNLGGHETSGLFEELRRGCLIDLKIFYKGLGELVVAVVCV
jgi:hypothetical protein